VPPGTSTGSAAPIPVTGQVVNVAANSPNKLMLSVLTAVAIVLAVAVVAVRLVWFHTRGW